jgi:uncharacterized protein YfaT (DUF1175 family)
VLALALLAMLAAPAVSRPPDSALLRRIVAETALAQVKSPDARWNPEQRDCAGLVRFAYAQAFRQLHPERVETGLWKDGQGRQSSFADAETLLAESFVAIGRDDAARAHLESGDLVAFRQGTADEPVYHLMLVIASDDPAHGDVLVVYHPGAKGASVRSGRLDDLAREAPKEWRPEAGNAGFLGFYRFKEWERETGP